MTRGIELAENNFSLSMHFHRIVPRHNLQELACYHTLRICCILQGKAVWTIGSKQYPVSKGDVIILNNNEYRAIHTVYPPDDLRMMFLEFEPRFIWSNPNEGFDARFLKVFLERDNNFQNKLEASSLTAQEIEGLMWQIATELREKKPEYMLMSKVKLMNILVCLNRFYGSISETSSNKMQLSKLHLEGMSNVLNYIENHISEAISLDEIADMVHMNPSYFSRVFKKYNGLGLSEYINRRRIQMSIHYLMDSNLSVLEIASRCGYNGTSNFYKVFKSVTGKIPSEYRKDSE